MIATARRAPFCSAAPHLSNAVHHQLRRQIVRPADRYMRRCQDRLYSLVSAGSRQPRQPRFTARPDRPEARRHAEPDRDGLAATAFPVILPIPGTSSIAHLEESLASAPLRLSADEYRTRASLRYTPGICRRQERSQRRVNLCVFLSAIARRSAPQTAGGGSGTRTFGPSCEGIAWFSGGEVAAGRAPCACD